MRTAMLRQDLGTALRVVLDADLTSLKARAWALLLKGKKRHRHRASHPAPAAPRRPLHQTVNQVLRQGAALAMAALRWLWATGRPALRKALAWLFGTALPAVSRGIANMLSRSEPVRVGPKRPPPSASPRQPRPTP